MSLEVSINNLADAMNRLAYAIEAGNTVGANTKGAMPETTPEPEAKAEPAPTKAPAKAKAKPAAKKPEPEVEPEQEEKAEAEPQPEPELEEQPTVSLDQLKSVFGQLSKVKGGMAVKQILNDYGYEGFGKVPADSGDIAGMYAVAQKQLA